MGGADGCAAGAARGAGGGGTRRTRRAVEAKGGGPPERMVDVLGLVGASVENVPGVPGIGDKGARDLVRTYGPIEAVLEHAGEVKRKAYREGLQNHADLGDRVPGPPPVQGGSGPADGSSSQFECWGRDNGTTGGEWAESSA